MLHSTPFTDDCGNVEDNIDDGDLATKTNELVVDTAARRRTREFWTAMVLCTLNFVAVLSLLIDA